MSTLKVSTLRNEADSSDVAINRTTSDGTIVDLQKDGTTVGSIGASGGDAYIAGTTHGIKFDSIDASTMYIRPVNNTGSNVTGQIDLGQAGNVFRDAYLSGGLYFAPNSYPANYLDDYEEGTFTASFGGSTDTITGYYTKVGQLVSCIVYSADLNVTTSTGAIVYGFPFNCRQEYTAGTITHCTYSNAQNGYMVDDQTYFQLVQSNSASAATTNVGSPKYVMVQVNYTTD